MLESLKLLNFSGANLELGSINGNESSQNLNDCSELNWFFCSVCNRTFADKGEFNLHNHEHLPNEKPDAESFTEDVLNVQTQSTKKKKTKQKKTVKIKSGDKKAESKVCMECGKQYQTNYKLQEHMRKHTGEKPFLCSYQDCRKAFRYTTSNQQCE